LDADTHAEKRGELAGLLSHGDNGGTIGDTENPARLAVKADDIASAETEWKTGFHLEFGETNKRACAASAARRARSASARSRAMRSPSKVVTVNRLKACGVNENSCWGTGKGRLLRFMGMLLCD